MHLESQPTMASTRCLILASASPRRRSLLQEHGYDPRIIPPNVSEPQQLSAATTPTQLAEALSFFKAKSIADHEEVGVVLGADTVVSAAGRVFGKPDDRDDAQVIIKALAGTTHDVITGVTLIDAATHERIIRHDTTAVTMRPMDEAEITAYLDTGAWRGKAGAYGIQDHGDAFVTAIVGSFTNVVGLPMELVTELLTSWGVLPARPPSHTESARRPSGDDRS